MDMDTGECPSSLAGPSSSSSFQQQLDFQQQPQQQFPQMRQLPVEHMHLDVPDQIVCVRTGDGRRFKVPLMVMRHSILYMMNAFLPNGQPMKEFDIGDVTGMIFEKLLEWCQQYPGMWVVKCLNDWGKSLDVPYTKVEVDPHTRVSL